MWSEITDGASMSCAHSRCTARARTQVRHAGAASCCVQRQIARAERPARAIAGSRGVWRCGDGGEMACVPAEQWALTEGGTDQDAVSRRRGSGARAGAGSVCSGERVAVLGGWSDLHGRLHVLRDGHAGLDLVVGGCLCRGSVSLSNCNTTAHSSNHRVPGAPPSRGGRLSRRSADAAKVDNLSGAG